MTARDANSQCHQTSLSPSPAAGWQRSWPRAAAPSITSEPELVDERPPAPSASDWRLKGSALTLEEHTILARAAAATFFLDAARRGPQDGH